MTIFQKDNAADTKWEYKITTVSVSLLTYLVALTSIIAVNWGDIKRNLSSRQRERRAPSESSVFWSTVYAMLDNITRIYKQHWQRHPSSDSITAGGTTASAPDMQAVPARAPPEPKADKAGQPAKRQFPWFVQRRDSSSLPR
jgi:hypothetical protein